MSLRAFFRFVCVALLVALAFVAWRRPYVLQDQVDGRKRRGTVLTAPEARAASDHVRDLLRLREEKMPLLIEAKEREIAGYEREAAVWASEPEGAIYSQAKRNLAEGERQMILSFRRQKNALRHLREEMENDHVRLEVRQLPNSHIALLVKDMSVRINAWDERVPDLSVNELIARDVVMGLAPVCFDRATNKGVYIDDILLVGMPRVINPDTGGVTHPVAYKYRYPAHRAALVVNFEEARIDRHVQQLLRPTVWRL